MSNLARRFPRVGTKRRASDRLDLPPVTKEEQVNSSERARFFVASELVAANLADNLADDILQLPKQLCGHHADLIDQDETQTLAFRREFVVVARQGGALCLTDRDAAPMVDCETVDNSSHGILKSEAHELHTMRPSNQLLIRRRREST